MYEDTDRPQPSAEDRRGSLGGGVALFWILFPVWAYVGAVASVAPRPVFLLGLTTPLLLAAILALCGKSRTGMGVALGYASVFAVALLLFMLLANLRMPLR